MGTVKLPAFSTESSARARRAAVSPNHAAFSVIELLVVIGMIAVLIAFLLPTLNTARQQMITVKCMSQMRQLGAACEMYANENRGWMASADTCGPLSLPPELFVDPSGNQTNVKWTGWVDSGSSSQAIQNGTIWPYVKNMAVYHCPNDINPYRLRSYSMNAYIDTGLNTSPITNAYKIYQLSQAAKASNTILFAEDPDPRSASGNESVMAAVSQSNVNGWSQTPRALNTNGAWGNLVAAWHSGGANFAFLDGHAEYWKYKDQRTINSLQNDPNWPNTVYTTENNPDLNRISAAVVTWPPQRPH